MAATNENSDRRVVPRWRSFKDALATGELAVSAKGTENSLDGKEFLHEKEAEWITNRELPFALDLIGAAIVLGVTPSAKEAAETVLASDQASTLSRKIASKVLGLELPEFVGHIDLPEQVQTLKAARVRQPRNAFVWADLARLYVVLGQNTSAARALQVAYALAPDDRFILRSVTRFCLHIQEPDRALSLLRSTPKTPEDPWLTAAEIAVSCVVGKIPRFVKKGIELLNGLTFHPFHTSELASALASLEMFNGREKRANKLFLHSLSDPTDNSLAQVVWASKRLHFGRVNQQLLNTPRASEAKTFDAFNQKEWEAVVHNAQNWWNDEAFSARPRVLASAVAVSLLGKAALGEEIAKGGLTTNPGHPALINNIAFALIHQGKAPEALEVISKVDRSQLTPTDAICLMATAGLAEFRNGNPQEGKEFYESAISAASRHKAEGLKTLAMLYLSRERVLRGEKEALSDFRKASDSAQKHPNTTIPEIAAGLEKEVMAAEVANRSKSSGQ